MTEEKLKKREHNQMLCDSFIEQIEHLFRDFEETTGITMSVVSNEECELFNMESLTQLILPSIKRTKLLNYLPRIFHSDGQEYVYGDGKLGTLSED